jgi:hypothetical protein
LAKAKDEEGIPAMLASCSVFVQLLKTIPRAEFQQLAAEHQSERHARGFTSWQQLVAMLFCHLGKAHSLREIEYGLSSAEGKLSHLGVQVPSRSTLAYANAHRPWQLFEAVFYTLAQRCASVQTGRHRLRFRNPLRSIDSTTIDLVSSMFDWAKYGKSKGAIKLHLMLDHDGLLPRFAVVTDGKSADVAIGRQMPAEPGSIFVFDRGYVDYEWFRSLSWRGVHFVTRLKKNAHFDVVEERPVPQSRSVTRDQLVDVYDVRKGRSPGYVPLRLRRVEVVDPEDGKHLVIYSNLLEFGATTIARIYKERWQIELFFKTLKQNLKIKTFIGTSANALWIQMWTALIAMLIVRYLKLKNECRWSLSNLFAMLRFHLFAHRDLMDWLRNALTDSPGPPAEQLKLI